MRRALAFLLLLLPAGVVRAQAVVNASPPEKVAVTIYRDPDRDRGGQLALDDLRGFATISETRTVTLPPGKSVIRFQGVAESMASVTAIVTGLPGGIVEKNRDAALLSPASLVDGSLGNRVTISRTNPATGQVTSEEAIVRTRADGGLILQTGAGYEAVRCSGLPEKLVFDGAPDGLSATPQFSVGVDVPAGGTFKVVLSYLAAGFDWQAHYVTHFEEGGTGERKARMLAWLTLANDNGQSFTDADLLAVAGRVNIQTRPADLSAPVSAPPLYLTCYPFGSTSAGLPPPPPPPPPPSAPLSAMASEAIVITGSRIQRRDMAMNSPVAMVASEEQLGDLKLYRVPEAVTVASRSLKQVAFMDREGVRGSLLYDIACMPDDHDADGSDPRPSRLTFVTRNDKQHGLGLALPAGNVSLFAPAAQTDLLLDEAWLDDRPVGQEVELGLQQSALVTGQCLALGDEQGTGKTPRRMRLMLGNANGQPARVRISLGSSIDWRVVKAPGKPFLRDGLWRMEVTVPRNGAKTLSWTVQHVDSAAE